MLYFAYGSNLWKRGMLRRCPKAQPVAPARLAGYRLTFQGYALIVPDPKGVVLGALYRLTPADLRALDEYEEAPRLYRRVDITVETDDGSAEAFIYLMNPDAARGLSPQPEPAYYGEIARGYNDWKLDPTVLRRARFGAMHDAGRRSSAGPGGTSEPPSR